MADDLKITLNDGAELYGWETIQVTRSAEHFPSGFSITATEKYPNSAVKVPIKEGEPCMVHLGDDLVLTGYIDRYDTYLDQNQHTIRISGRSKGQDLTDASAELLDASNVQRGHFNNLNIVELARKLADPYGITIDNQLTSTLDNIPFLTINPPETAYEIIERVAKYYGFLVYDNPEGNVVLSEVGTNRAAGGIFQGQNVQSAQSSFSQDQRYSEYIVMSKLPVDLNQFSTDKTIAVGRAPDNEVLRQRKLYIYADAFVPDVGYQARRAKWEASWRWARSKQIHVVVDTWRDAVGKLWEPNTIVQVSVPAVKVDYAEWLISTVTYRRDAQGTTAQLVLMPPSALEVAPPTAPVGGANADVGNAVTNTGSGDGTQREVDRSPTAEPTNSSGGAPAPPQSQTSTQTQTPSPALLDGSNAPDTFNN